MKARASIGMSSGGDFSHAVRENGPDEISVARTAGYKSR